MAVPRKLVAVPNAATRELWRIAESGAIDELEDVLPQADINARNEHGMTALMRAAYHGRVQMVRVLLEHGADPNLSRNDNFTALSLAAFFGHGEIVDILMRHGANTNVATRFGTSPHIWAKARSFGDVARSLEKRTVEAKQSVPPPVVHAEPEPVSKPQREHEPLDQPIAVRTLSEPPEIWDLVHEAPRNFNARSVFMARMGSLKGGVAIAIVLLVVIGAGAGAVYWMKDTIRSTPVSAPAATAATKPPVASAAQPPATNSALPETAPAPLPETQSPSVDVNAAIPVPRRSRSFARARTPENAVINNETESTQTATAPAPPATVKTESRASTDAEPKNTASPLSHQMIAPPKPSQPKAKVIQWP
jgi:hypothetical protein